MEPIFPRTEILSISIKSILKRQTDKLGEENEKKNPLVGGNRHDACVADRVCDYGDLERCSHRGPRPFHSGNSAGGIDFHGNYDT